MDKSLEFAAEFKVGYNQARLGNSAEAVLSLFGPLALEGYYRFFADNKGRPFTSVVEIVRYYSEKIDNSRTVVSTLDHAFGEMRELDDEVGKYIRGEPLGEDGIVGECMDVINCILDLLYQAHPEITEEDMIAIQKRKCDKWVKKYSKL